MEHEAVTWPLFAWPINALRHGGEISYENYRGQRERETVIKWRGWRDEWARLSGELVLNWPPIIFFPITRPIFMPSLQFPWNHIFSKRKWNLVNGPPSTRKSYLNSFIFEISRDSSFRINVKLFGILKGRAENRFRGVRLRNNLYPVIYFRICVIITGKSLYYTLKITLEREHYWNNKYNSKKSEQFTCFADRTTFHPISLT